MNVTRDMFTQLVTTCLETYVDEILGDYQCGFRRSRPETYVDEILGDYQCGFRRSRPETDDSCSLRKILEKSYGYCVDIYYLCMRYKQVYDTNLHKSPTTALYTSTLMPLY